MTAMKTTLAFVVLPAVLAGPAPRDQEPLRPAGSPDDRVLMSKQEYIKQQFRDLTVKMLKVAEALEETEPASARAIQEAVNLAQRSLIEQNMSRVVEYLGRGLIAIAESTQESVVEDLKRVLRALESSVLGLDEMAEKLKDWEGFLARIDQLIADQLAHQRASHVAAKGKQLGQRMAGLNEKLRELIGRQKKLLGETRDLPEAAAGAGKLVEALNEIRRLIRDQGRLNDETADATPGRLLMGGQEQKDLKQRTEKLRDELVRLGEQPEVKEFLANGPSGATAVAAAAGHLTDAAGEMGRSVAALDATNAAEAEPHQQQALADLKDAASRLAEAIRRAGAGSRAGALVKPQTDLGKETSELAGQVKAAMAEANVAGESETSPSASEADRGGENLDRAAGHMARAAEKLTEQSKPDALDEQTKALERMEDQSARLGELSRRLTRQAEQTDLQQQKQDQDVTAEQTRQLAEKMGKSSESDRPTPGKQSVAGAAGSMERASGELGRGNAGKASSAQGEAVDKLRKARRDLGEAIDQARDDVQTQTLVEIDAILTEILKAQQNITRGTAETFARRTGKTYERPQILKLAQLSDGEGQLAEKVGKVLKVVREEATTAVFPVILDETRGDLTNVQKLLAGKQAGPLPQSIQKEIEKNLEAMIASLRQEVRRRRAGGGRCPGGGGGKGPLIPMVAELKMLRALQMQINERTLTLDAQRRDRALAEVELRLQHRILADREGRLAEMTKELGKKLRPERAAVSPVEVDR